MNPIRPLHGFTLIELLVAVVILSVGLLGLAGMQITGLRSVNNASSYTQATLAVNDLVERIRANPVASDANAFAAIDSETGINCAAMPDPYCSAYYDGATLAAVEAESCTPAELAQYDLNVWFCGENSGNGRNGAMSETFPLAALIISCIDIDDTDADACTYGSRHTLSFSWEELNPDRDSNNPDETLSRNITLTIQP
ncbi:MAG TPA: type IV pilus modification protein PilV [Gammaproteobacteria bacterium]